MNKNDTITRSFRIKKDILEEVSDEVLEKANCRTVNEYAGDAQVCTSRMGLQRTVPDKGLTFEIKVRLAQKKIRWNILCSKLWQTMAYQFQGFGQVSWKKTV